MDKTFTYAAAPTAKHISPQCCMVCVFGEKGPHVEGCVKVKKDKEDAAAALLLEQGKAALVPDAPPETETYSELHRRPTLADQLKEREKGIEVAGFPSTPPKKMAPAAIAMLLGMGLPQFLGDGLPPDFPLLPNKDASTNDLWADSAKIE